MRCPWQTVSLAVRFQDPGRRQVRRCSNIPPGLELLEGRTLLSATLVKNLSSTFGSALSSNPVPLASIDGVEYFVATDRNGAQLWRSDGRYRGTRIVKDINPFGDAFDLTVGSFGHSFAVVNDTLYFAADDGVHGQELWKSDGTAAGTVLVRDINPGPAPSQPYNLTNVNGTLFFDATTPSTGTELWKSDGTPAGTSLVKDILPGQAGSYPYDLTNVNGVLLFAAYDSQHENVLWRSDGTEAGTQVLKNVSPRLGIVQVGASFFFGGFQPSTGSELWKTDGTPAGTMLVKDINRGTGSSYPNSLVNSNNELYFVADDGVHGPNLWKSDGTDQGTQLVKVFPPGPDFRAVWNLTDVKGELFFLTADYESTVTLWKSNGTANGTVPVLTGVYDSYSGPPSLNPYRT